MDGLKYFFTRFFDQLSTTTTPEFSTWWLLPAILCGFILLMWVVHFVSKAHEWKQGKVRFGRIALFKRPSAKFPKGHSAHVIDFVAAGEKLRRIKELHLYELSHPSVAAEIRTLRTKDRDSLDFASIIGKRGTNDDGPDAA